jgi:hypothetical protein
MASSDHQQDPHTFSASQVPLPHDAADDDGAETLSPLEQEVLDEYARLLGNLNNVRRPFAPRLPSRKCGAAEECNVE